MGQDLSHQLPQLTNRSKTQLPPIPLNVIDQVCLHLRLDHCGRTLLNVLLASRATYEIAAPHLYRNVHISKKSMKSLFRGIIIATEEQMVIRAEGFIGYPWRRSSECQEAGDGTRTTKAQRKKWLDEYLLEGGYAGEKVSLALQESIEKKPYPHAASQRRKLALLRRTARIILVDIPSPAAVTLLRYVSTRPDFLLFPSVTEMVFSHQVTTALSVPYIQGYKGDSTHMRTLRTYLAAIREMAAPKRVCFSVHPTTLRDHNAWDRLSLDETDSYNLSTFIRELSIGDLYDEISFHHVTNQALPVISTAHNRYYFEFCPYESSTRCKYTVKQYNRRSQMSTVLFALERDTGWDESNFTFVDAGRLGFVNASEALEEEKGMVEEVLDLIDRSSPRLDEDESKHFDKWVEKLSFQFSGDADECECCRGLGMNDYWLPKMSKAHVDVT